MCAAGLEGIHDRRIICVVSVLAFRSKPRVGCMPLTLIVMEVEGTNGLVDRWKSSGDHVAIEWIVRYLSLLSSMGIVCGADGAGV